MIKFIHDIHKIIYTKEQRKWLYVYTVLYIVAECFGVYALIQLFKKK